MADIQADSTISDVQVVDELPARALIRFQWSSDDSPVFELLSKVNAPVIDAEGNRNGWTLNVRFPSSDTLRDFYQICGQRDLGIEIRDAYETEATSWDERFGLSNKQSETLKTALAAGYFDIPREITLQELAEDIGVSEQAVSERLRRALQRYVTVVFSEEMVSDEDHHQSRR